MLFGKIKIVLPAGSKFSVRSLYPVYPEFCCYKIYFLPKAGFAAGCKIRGISNTRYYPDSKFIIVEKNKFKIGTMYINPNYANA